MTASFVQWQHPTPTCVGTSAIKNCGTKLQPPLTLLKGGLVLSVEQRTTTQTTALIRPFVVACNTLDHQIAEHPELQSAVISTMASVHKTHARFNISAYPARAPILASPVQTGDQPLAISEAPVGPLRPLSIECDQAYKPLLTFKHAMHPTPLLPLESAHAHTSTCILCTKASQHTSTTLTHHTPCNTTAQTKPVECTWCTNGLHTTCTPCTTSAEFTQNAVSLQDCHTTVPSQPFHNLCTNSPSSKHAHSEHTSQQLQDLITTNHLTSKPRTPIDLHTLQRELKFHPDQAFVQTLLHNLGHGCNIGFNGPQFTHFSNNLPSSFQHPSILDANIATECNLGRMLGPFQIPPLPNFRCSGLGLVPKHDGGWRAIYHLSAPYGSSINDSINAQDFTLSYCSVDDAFAMVSALGKGTLMAKIDLKNAFRLIPVRPEDWNLLGIRWQNQYYIDTCLPFGLRSAPFLFNQLADAIHWSLQHNHGVHNVLHYLDDFFTAGKPATTDCSNNLQAMLSLCRRINAPVKTSKIEGPSTQLTFLGIVINTENMTAGISPEHKVDLLLSIQALRQKDKCTKHQLLSLVGKLSFACKVVPAGRIFLRRLIDLSCKVKRMHHHIRLCTDAHLDLDWWLAFLPHWNGTSNILESKWSTSPSMSLFTDASGSLGWGADWSGHWIQSHWSPQQAKQDIVWKELFAIASAVNTWGHQWPRKKILVHCDNQAVVDIWKKGTTNCPQVMALVRMLYFCAAQHNIHIIVSHVAGTDNCIADALSRFQVHRFHRLAPQAALSPDTIPAWPIQLLIACSATINP